MSDNCWWCGYELPTHRSNCAMVAHGPTLTPAPDSEAARLLKRVMEWVDSPEVQAVFQQNGALSLSHPHLAVKCSHEFSEGAALLLQSARAHLARQPAAQSDGQLARLEGLVSEHLSAKTQLDREWSIGGTAEAIKRGVDAHNALHAYMMEKQAARLTPREK